jgi:ParB-like chromosome segregation protein Spo0J
VESSGWLKYGERWHWAAKMLGWKTVPPVVTDAPAVLAERDENELRKGLTSSERVEMAKPVVA